MQNDAPPSHLRLAVDNTPRRSRRQIALPQASINRAIRAAEAAGPYWQIRIDGNVIHLFQGKAPGPATVAPEKRWRL